MPDHVDADAPCCRVWDLAINRFRVLAPLAAAKRNTHAAVEAAADELGIGRVYCYRLIHRLRADPTVAALLPRARGRATGSRLLDENVESIILAAVELLNLDRQQPTVAALKREVARRCVEQGLKVPTYKAVAARVRASDRLNLPGNKEATVSCPSSEVLGPPNHPELSSFHDDALTEADISRREIDNLCCHVWEYSGVSRDIPIRLLRSAGIAQQLEDQARWEAAAAHVIWDSVGQLAGERRETRAFYRRIQIDARSLQRRIEDQFTDSDCPHYSAKILQRVQDWSMQRAAEAPSTNRISGRAARAFAVNAMRLFVAAFRTKPTVYIDGPARIFLSEAFRLAEQYAKHRNVVVRIPSARSVLQLVRNAVQQVDPGPEVHWQTLLGISPS